MSFFAEGIINEIKRIGLPPNWHIGTPYMHSKYMDYIQHNYLPVATPTGYSSTEAMFVIHRQCGYGEPPCTCCLSVFYLGVMSDVSEVAAIMARVHEDTAKPLPSWAEPRKCGHPSGCN